MHVPPLSSVVGMPFCLESNNQTSETLQSSHLHCPWPGQRSSTWGLWGQEQLRSLPAPLHHLPIAITSPSPSPPLPPRPPQSPRSRGKLSQVEILHVHTSQPEFCKKPLAPGPRPWAQTHSSGSRASLFLVRPKVTSLPLPHPQGNTWIPFLLFIMNTEEEHRKSLTSSYPSSWFSDYLFMLLLFHLHPHPLLTLDPSIPHIPPQKKSKILYHPVSRCYFATERTWFFKRCVHSLVSPASQPYIQLTLAKSLLCTKR